MAPPFTRTPTTRARIASRCDGATKSHTPRPNRSAGSPLPYRLAAARLTARMLNEPCPRFQVHQKERTPLSRPHLFGQPGRADRHLEAAAQHLHGILIH